MQKQKRQRGVVLTSEGLQKLQAARLESEKQNNFGERYTLEQLSEITRLDINTFKKVWDGKQGVDKRTIERIFIAFGLELDKNYYSDSILNKRTDWGEAICTSAFYGRTEELEMLSQSILRDRCRLVALVGIGGIGKTVLSVKFAEQVQDKFEYVIWRSLREAPPIKDILANLIQFLSDEEETEANLPETVGDRVSRLIDYLRKHRCLLVLDNAESILRSGSRVGEYREGYEGYSELLRRVGETAHQSGLILTTREKPREVVSLEGEGLPVRSLRLSGLKVAEGQEIFKLKRLSGAEDEWQAVIERYCGNPLALKVVATSIQELFDGNISEFLQQDTAVFGDIRDLLDRQFERLSDLEKDIMYWLAINRELVTLSELREDIVSPVPQQNLLSALDSLVRRSLVEKSTSFFTLQPVVMEYVTQRFVEQVCQEIASHNIELFRCHALMKATAKDYIKEAQVRLILQPVIDGLIVAFKSKRVVEGHLTQIIVRLQETSPLESGYTAGNIINLLCQLGTSLRGYDFSYLTIWQADLQCVQLQEVNFAHAEFDKSVFAETFGGVLSVAFSPDGKLLATGDTNGEIRLRQVADGQPVLTCKGHTNWVLSLAFSPNGSVLASGSTDQTVKLWDVSTGQCLYTLQEHSHEVWSVAFSPDGDLLASASDDQTMKLWSVRTGQCLRTFQGHTSWVLSVAFSPDGQTLVSGSDDHTVKIWDFSTGECLKTFHGHLDGIRTIAISPDGQMLASGSEDKTVKLWNVSTGECLETFQGHSNEVYSVAFSPQGDFLASSSFDKTVRLWDVSTAECLKTFQGHSSWVFSVAFSPKSDLLVSGSYDQTARLWSIHTGECLKTFQGYTNQVFSVAFSPDGQTLASGSHDSSMRLWDVRTGQCLKTFQGHRGAIQSVDFSPDGQTLASGSHDSSMRLWDVSTGQCFKTFQGHRALIWSVAFCLDGQTLASSSDDKTVKLWDVSTGQCLRTLQGHQASVWSVAFSSQETMLASGSTDQTVKLWDISTGECKKTLLGHTTWVSSVTFSPGGELLASTSPDGTLRFWSVYTGENLRILQASSGWLHSVAFSPDSQVIAGCSQDNTVKLWNVSTGQCLRTLQGHTGRLWSVVYSSDNQTLASSGDDETIRLWNIATGECLKTLKAEQRYKRMNIMGVEGLTEATIATLKVLGAVT